MQDSKEISYQTCSHCSINSTNLESLNCGHNICENCHKEQLTKESTEESACVICSQTSQQEKQTSECSNCAKLTSKIEELQNQKRFLQESNVDENSKLLGLQQELNDFIFQIQAQAKKIQNQELTISDLQQQVESLNNQIRNLKQYEAGYKQFIEVGKQVYQMKVQNYESSLELIQQRASQLQKHFQSLQLEKQNAQLMSKPLEETSEEQLAEVQRCRTQIQQLSDENEQLKSQLKEQNQNQSNQHQQANEFPDKIPYNQLIVKFTEPEKLQLADLLIEILNTRLEQRPENFGIQVPEEAKCKILKEFKKEGKIENTNVNAMLEILFDTLIVQEVNILVLPQKVLQLSKIKEIDIINNLSKEHQELFQRILNFTLELIKNQ